jgi:hypothetical protein
MANGFYHNYNVLKCRILRLLFDVFKDPNIPYPGWISGVHIKEVLGYDNQASITHMLGRYKKQGIIRKSSKRFISETGYGSYYRWHISKKGINLLFDLENRLRHGQTLNRRPKFRGRKVDKYIGISKRGALELGITREDTKLIESCFIPQSIKA